GGDVGLVFVQDGIPVDPRGTFVVNGGGNCGGSPCSALANYIDNFSGNGGNVSRFFGNTVVNPVAPHYAPYFQDSCRVRPKLPLDWGMRCEYWRPPENVRQFPALQA